MESKQVSPAVWILGGAVIGTGLGALLGNFPMGMGLGAAFGIIALMVVVARNKDKADQNEED